MKDFTQRIKDRADILNIDLKGIDIDYLNMLVHKRISRGLSESDALDYVYFELRDNYGNNNQ